uniref:Gastrokine-2 n=1 Tax=Salvator merianae TaxID=96440 RepID=A0A8D0DPU0_SALMN
MLLPFSPPSLFLHVQMYRFLDPNGAYVQQTVTIDNKNQVADIHVYGGSCSSDTIFDYKHGYIATRIFSRRACFILKMEKGYVMELEELGRLAYEKQMMKKMISPQDVWVKYEPKDSLFGEIREWFQFGSSIEHLCKNVPVYRVERVDPGFQSRSCVKAGILGILGISVCGSLTL